MTDIFQFCGEVPVAKLKLKIANSSFFSHQLRALREEGGMSPEPGASFYLSYSAIEFRWMERLAVGSGHRECSLQLTNVVFFGSA